ncbi:MAG: NTP transferase domain-containing protein [Alphaproteobacteria bacterium]|nr:NTP transferase domain-containing protein [Alphaproteobacteria bacterium]
MTAEVGIPAIILAGGLGTRLRSVTNDKFPKPMAPIPLRGKSHPFLEFPLAHLKAEGFTDIIICIGHLGDQIRRHFGDGRQFGLTIRYDDAGDADTARRIWGATQLLGAPKYLVVCGDVFHPFGLGEFIEDFCRHPQWLMQLAVVPTAGDISANLALGPGCEITDYDARGVQGEYVGIEAGTLTFRDTIFEGDPVAADLSLTANIYPSLIAQRALGGKLVTQPFFDIGTPESYNRFCQYAGAGHAQPVSWGTQ